MAFRSVFEIYQFQLYNKNTIFNSKKYLIITFLFSLKILLAKQNDIYLDSAVKMAHLSFAFQWRNDPAISKSRISNFFKLFPSNFMSKPSSHKKRFPKTFTTDISKSSTILIHSSAFLQAVLKINKWKNNFFSVCLLISSYFMKSFQTSVTDVRSEWFNQASQKSWLFGKQWTLYAVINLFLFVT